MTDIPEHLEPENLETLSLENLATNIQSNDESEQKGLEYKYKLEVEKQRHENEMQKLGYVGGSIGKWLGHGQEKAGNIAGLSILASFVLIGFIILSPTTEDESKHRFLLIPSSIATLALGYLFGKR